LLIRKLFCARRDKIITRIYQFPHPLAICPPKDAFPLATPAGAFFGCRKEGKQKPKNCRRQKGGSATAGDKNEPLAHFIFCHKGKKKPDE